MVERKVIIDKVVGFANAKLSEMSGTNPFVLVVRPFIARAINNNITKFDSLLKIVQDEKGMIDIEGIMNEMVDNLLVAQVKKYPDVLGGVEIGNGTVKINIPMLNKAVEFDTDDIKAFKETLIAK
jgi:hypothetical protein|nr:MAG TPA: hypothetical protein [Herelleviridae sp.]